MNKKIKGVLFDLDGTLLDTAPALGFALNTLLKQHQRPTLSIETIRPHAGHGSAPLIELGFGFNDRHPQFKSLLHDFLKIYRDNLEKNCVLFPGMNELITHLKENNFACGIVTNKPGWLTKPLLEALKIEMLFDCIISGDTLSKCKPDPTPLLHACKLLSLTPDECIYIGDSERDMLASKNAGMRSILVLYGYIRAEDQPNTWGADILVKTAGEILEIVSLSKTQID